VSANFIEIFKLVWAAFMVNTKFGILEFASLPELGIILLEADTWSKSNEFEESVDKEIFFPVG